MCFRLLLIVTNAVQKSITLLTIQNCEMLESTSVNDFVKDVNALLNLKTNVSGHNNTGKLLAKA
jgi:hypothetical protein